MKRFFIRIVLLAAAFVALQGCNNLYREDMENCYDGVSVVLRVDPSMSEAAAAEAVAESAILYVFDSEGKFLERRETQVGKTELFSYQEAGPLTVVGWINKCNTYNITKFDETVLRQNGLVTLLRGASNRAGEGDHLFPTDLFYGHTELANERMSLEAEHKEVLATRRTGQATVTVRGLKQYSGMADNDFYIVTGPTGSVVDFYGNYTTWGASHTSALESSSDDEFVTGGFNLMPTAASTPMKVEIWHRTEGLVYSTVTHHLGGDIHIEADRTTNILIDFSMGVTLRIEKTLWGVEYAWKIFG